MRSRLLLPGALCILLSCSQKPAPITLHGAHEGAGSTGAHIVMAGDTLGNIAGHYNITARDIAMFNQIPAPFTLKPGQRLKLPPPREYRVRHFDNLYIVSRLFGVSTSEIARQNNLAAPYALREGQILRMPPLDRPMAMAVAQNPSYAASPGISAPVERVAMAEPIAPRPVNDWQSQPSPITAQTPPRSGAFLTPVNGPVISSYGPSSNGLHNDGINFQAPAGAPVMAAENGVVVYAGNDLKGSGNLVLLRHEDGWVTAYAHMDSIVAQRGAVVRKGQEIGRVGATGSVDQPQLHFEIRRGVEAVDPQKHLDI